MWLHIKSMFNATSKEADESMKKVWRCRAHYEVMCCYAINWNKSEVRSSPSVGVFNSEVEKDVLVEAESQNTQFKTIFFDNLCQDD